MCSIGPHSTSACPSAASIKCLLRPPAPVPDAPPCLSPVRRESVPAERQRRGGQSKDGRKHSWAAVEEKHMRGGGGGSASHVTLPSGPSHAENLSTELHIHRETSVMPLTSTRFRSYESYLIMCNSTATELWNSKQVSLDLKTEMFPQLMFHLPVIPTQYTLGNEYGN